MRGFFRKGGSIAGEHTGLHLQPKGVVDERETLEQPQAEESSAARNEKGRATRLLPQPARVLEHVGEVFSRKGFDGARHGKGGIDRKVGGLKKCSGVHKF